MLNVLLRIDNEEDVDGLFCGPVINEGSDKKDHQLIPSTFSKS